MQWLDWPEWCCPEHGEPLVAGADDLRCPAGEKFDVVKGIPRFAGGRNYADHFGAQWLRFRRTQLDSYTGLEISKKRLERCLGGDFAKLAGRHVLECGCGAGRFTEVLLAQGARVTSIDLSTAVDANAGNFPPGARHRIAQADILRLPFRKRSFDLVLCLGVIQHTPSPERTIAALYEQVAPEGTLAIDHYTVSIGWYTKSAPLFRQVLKRMPPEKAFQVTDLLVNTLLPVHKRVNAIPVVRSVVARLSPVLSYYGVYPELRDELQREWSLLDTHDVLTDYYKHFRTRRQISGAMEGLGMKNVWCVPGGNGVEARGERPA